MDIHEAAKALEGNKEWTALAWSEKKKHAFVLTWDDDPDRFAPIIVDFAEDDDLIPREDTCYLRRMPLKLSPCNKY